MTGIVLQVSISRGGVPKRAIPEGLITSRGVEGDACAHPAIHGNSAQALLLVTAEGIEELKAKGYPLFYGAMGENLTTQGLDRRQIQPGQRFRVGGAVIEITKLRRPCNTLDVYGPGIRREVFDPPAAGDPASSKWGLAGFYASVILPGNVRTGDSIFLVEQLA